MAELIVSMAILSFLMVLYAYATGLLGRYSSKASAAESVQKDELQRRLDFIIEERFRDALNLASDDLLKECLQEPCLEHCKLQKDWKPLGWKNVKLYRYKKTPLSDWTYVAGAHHISKDWVACPELPKPFGKEHDVTIPPRFPDNCRGRSIAWWRAGLDSAAEIRIEISVPDLDLRREIRYYVPFARQPGGAACEVRGGGLCLAPGSYLLSVDIAQDKAQCGDPAVQGGSDW